MFFWPKMLLYSCSTWLFCKTVGTSRTSRTTKSRTTTKENAFIFYFRNSQLSSSMQRFCPCNLPLLNMLRMRSVPKWKKKAIVYAGKAWTDFPLNISAKTPCNFEPLKFKSECEIVQFLNGFATTSYWTVTLWRFQPSTLTTTKFIECLVAGM